MIIYNLFLRRNIANNKFVVLRLFLLIYRFQEQAQSLAFSADGSVVAVGCLTGHWLIFDTQTRELLGQYKDGVEAIQVIQYSPDGTTLAVGSRDNNIYVYQIGEETNKCSRIGKCMVCSYF